MTPTRPGHRFPGDEWTLRIAVTPRSFRATPGEHHVRLRRPGVSVVFPSVSRVLTTAELAELVDGCDGLIAGLEPVTAEVLDAGPLRAVVRYGSGMDTVDLDACAARGVLVGATPGVNAVSVAELTIGLLLALARHVVHHDTVVRGGGWSRRTGIELRGRLLGVVGYGAVGREVASLAQGLGMRVVAYDPYVGSGPLVSLDELLDHSDAVSLHLPLSAETHGLLGSDAFARMRPGALLVNTARGPLVDESALYAALTTPGRLAGAALDVFAFEPPTCSPLFELDNVIVSPHAGGATREAIERMGVAAVDELLRLLA